MASHRASLAANRWRRIGPNGRKGLHMETGVIQTGADVLDSEGERLGGVIAASPEYIVVEQGFFFPTDFYIPRSVIEKIEDAIVYLTISKQEALSSGWSVGKPTPSPIPEIA